MEFHEIDTKGKLCIERVASMPAWTSNDIGRLVYDISSDTYYKASASEWQTLARELGDFAGLIMRPLFEYGSTVSIGINPGRYHHSGTLEQILKWTSGLTFTFGPGGSNGASESLGASEFHYLYIDDSALSGNVLTAGRFRNSTTGPTWSDTKLGWYDGNDRCVAAFLTNSSSQILKFWHINDFIRWDSPITAYSGTPSTTWSTQVTFDIPSFSKFCHATFYTGGGNDKDRLIYWRESNSTGNGFLIGRHYEDSSGDNQGDSNSIVIESRIVTDLTNKRIDVKNATGGATLTVYQNGYWLPNGM